MKELKIKELNLKVHVKTRNIPVRRHYSKVKNHPHNK